MDEATFWGVIDRARDGTGPEAPSASPERLREILEEEDDATVAAFGTRFYEEVARLNHWRLWNAGNVVGMDRMEMSGDMFHYFRAWIVGKGRVAVEQALRDPDGLVDYIAPGEDLWGELLEYVAVEIMEARGGEDPRGATEADADAEPDGTPLEDEALRAAYPRLAAKFG